jgi:hypothetical protein
MQGVSNDSIGSLPRVDSDRRVRVELDNARISRRISASRSGGLGDMLINVIDAADSKFCLLARFLEWPIMASDPSARPRPLQLGHGCSNAALACDRSLGRPPPPNLFFGPNRLVHNRFPAKRWLRFDWKKRSQNRECLQRKRERNSFRGYCTSRACRTIL